MFIIILQSTMYSNIHSVPMTNKGAGLKVQLALQVPNYFTLEV